MINICEVCQKTFKADKFHPKQKYCKSCGLLKKKERIAEWRKRHGRDYMRLYMRSYLRSCALLCMVLIPIVAEATWADRKYDAGYEDFSGTIGTRQTVVKPPPYEIATKISSHRYMALNRLFLKKRGWQSMRVDEEEEGAQMDDKETGAWSIEYGSTGTTSETTLLEAESVYGWKVRLGEVSEMLAGRSMTGDRIAVASFNPGPFNLLVTKTRGTITNDNEYVFLSNDPAANTMLTSAKPVTKKEGGDLRIPWEWRGTRGELELAAVNRFDEQERRWIRGYALAFNAASERLTFTFRNILKGFESVTRTTDTALSYTVFDNKATTIKTGVRYVDFTEPTMPRTGFTFSATRKFKEPPLSLHFNLDTYKQGTHFGKTIQGSANVMLFGTTLNVRRATSFTGSSSTTTDSMTLSRKEASLSVSQSLSTYLRNTSKTQAATIMLTPAKDIRGSMNYSLSTSNTVNFAGARTQTEMKNLGYALSIKRTTYTAVLNKYSQSHTITRQWDLNNRGIGQSFIAGLTFSRTAKSKSCLANFTYNF